MDDFHDHISNIDENGKESYVIHNHISKLLGYNDATLDAMS